MSMTPPPLLPPPNQRSCVTVNVIGELQFVYVRQNSAANLYDIDLQAYVVHKIVPKTFFVIPMYRGM